MSQWTYKPYLVDGEPAEVGTVVTVGFKLAPAGVSGAVPSLTYAPQPVLPPAVAATHTKGSVLIKATIGKDGKVKYAEAVSGPEILRQSAVDCVLKWRYTPYLENGVPTEVEKNITINFSANN